MNADLRLALRQLRKAPVFALTAVLTLALAIGANAIVFSVLNALVLRPLNVPHPDNLFMVERVYGAETTPSQSYLDYRDLRDMNRSFDSLVTYSIVGGVGLDRQGVHLDRPDDPVPVVRAERERPEDQEVERALQERFALFAVLFRRHST